MTSAEHNRQLANLIRLGTIAAVDHAAPRCRVLSGNLLTAWLPWITPRAGTTRTWSPPTIGEQCLLLCPSGEPGAGVVIVGLYADLHPAPSANPDEHVIEFPDGARLTYNHASGALDVSGVQTVRIAAAVSVTLDTPDVICTQRLTVEGLLTYRAGMAGSGGEGAAAVIDGSITATGDIRAGYISLRHHKTTDVQPGGGVSGEPSP